MSTNILYLLYSGIGLVFSIATMVWVFRSDKKQISKHRI